MNFSTRFKITFLVFSALGFLAIAIGIFTSWRVREAISEKLRENSANAVALSAANAADLQKSLFRRKVAQAMWLKETNRLQEQTIRSFSEAEGDLFDALGRMALADGFSILVMDNSMNIVFRHGDLNEDFNPYEHHDIKGRAIGTTMMSLARAGVPATALIHRQSAARESAKLFGYHFYLPEKKLLVGLWNDIAPQREAEQRGLDGMIETLAATFASTSLGTSGFLMVVDERGDIIIEPEDPALDMKTAILTSGSTLLGRIKKAAETPDKPIVAKVAWMGKGREGLVFVRQVKALGWYVIGVGFVDEIEATGRRLSAVLSIAILAISAGLALAAALMVGKFTAPLTRLANFAREVPKIDFLRDDEKSEVLETLARRPSRDEIGELARALSFMDGALRARIRELVETTGKRERMEGELHAATHIQMGFLPAPISEPDDRFRLAAELVPAREVGGDLYDYFMLDSHRLFVAIGDVSDKGVPAALFMSMTMVLLRSGAEAGNAPDAVLEHINRNLVRDNAGDMFVTLFLAVVDLETGEMRYANGGHNPPYIVSGSSVRQLEGAAGPLVGAFEHARFQTDAVMLTPGDAVFLYTDGVNEAMDSELNEFGTDALEEVLQECGRKQPSDMIEAVQAAVTGHVAGAPSSDDITMLAFSFEKHGG